MTSSITECSYGIYHKESIRKDQTSDSVAVVLPETCKHSCMYKIGGGTL